MKVGLVNKSVLRDIFASAQVQERVDKVAEAIESDARANAPVRSGNLRRNISHERVQDGDVSEVRVGWLRQGFYGALEELGTEDTAPRPHLRPAARKYVK